LELVENFLRWCSEDVVDFVHLVKLIVAWEERKEAHDFKEDAAYAPIVHFVVVISVC
jgi:hypothetical protein